jgi:outer membrane protein assembly factor BamB
MFLKKYLILIGLISLITYCHRGPTEPDKEEKNLNIIWKHDYLSLGAPNAIPVVIGDTLLAYTGGIGITLIKLLDGTVVWNDPIDQESELLGDKLLLSDEHILTVHKKELLGWNIYTSQKVLHKGEADGVKLFNGGENAVIIDGYALVGDPKINLHVLNKDGEMRFSYNTKPFTVNVVGYGERKIYTGQFRTVHGALTLGRITAVDSETGDSLWSYDTENGGFVRAAPIVENGVVYAGAVGNSPIKEFVALDAETGDVIWRQTEHVRTDNFLIGPKYVYVNTGASLAALDKTDGSIDWRFEWTSSAGLITPVYQKGYVYHSDHNRMFVLDGETGELVHEEPVPAGGSYFWHLAVSSDKLYAQTSRQLIAYQPWHLREE